jgi:hypothetical protein
MELNFLNEKLNIDVDKYHNVNESMFWEYYCLMLNIRNNILTAKDIQVLSYLLSLDADINLGNIQIIKQLSSDTKTAVSNIYTKYNQLIEKKFLIKKDSDYFLNPSLSSFQKYIKHCINNNKKCTIKFALPFNITNEHSR